MNELKHERIMYLKITYRNEGRLDTVNWFGFPCYEGDPDDEFGFRISGYEEYPCGNHFSAWIPIEDLVSMEIIPAEVSK